MCRGGRVGGRRQAPLLEMMVVEMVRSLAGGRAAALAAPFAARPRRALRTHKHAAIGAPRSDKDKTWSASAE